MTRRAPAALTGSGDAPASRDLVGFWRGFSRACWLGLQPGALESGDVLMAPSLRLPAAHGSDAEYIGPAGIALDLDDPDDLVHGYLAQTILRTVSLREPGGMSLHWPSPIADLSSVPLAMGPECSVIDRNFNRSCLQSYSILLRLDNSPSLCRCFKLVSDHTLTRLPSLRMVAGSMYL
jgi:hypothetical protein